MQHWAVTCICMYFPAVSSTQKQSAFAQIAVGTSWKTPPSIYDDKFAKRFCYLFSSGKSLNYFSYAAFKRQNCCRYRYHLWVYIVCRSRGHMSQKHFLPFWHPCSLLQLFFPSSPAIPLVFFSLSSPVYCIPAHQLCLCSHSYPLLCVCVFGAVTQDHAACGPAHSLAVHLTV